MIKITDNKTYLNWIEDYVKNHKVISGFCYSASLAMIKEFPELRQERGYVTDIYGSHGHWWCVAPDGSIVDPTAAQFCEIMEYDVYDEDKHGKLPTGKCMDCGNYVYNSNYFCNEKCGRKTLEYLKTGQL